MSQQASNQSLDVDVLASSPTQSPVRRSPLEILRATKPFVCENNVRSWFDLTSTLALWVALLALTTLEVAWYGRAGASFLAGLVSVRIFILYHDYQHGAILRRSRLAKVFMYVYGLLLLSPPTPWNRSHNYHHENNSKMYGASIGSFPVMTREAYARARRWVRFQYCVARHPLTILFGYFTVFLYGMTLRPFLLNPRQHLDCVAALGIHGALVGGLAWLDPGVLFFTLGLPFFIAAALGAYLFYAQHNFPDVKLRSRTDWDYAFAAQYSSSYLETSPLMGWVTANIGFHPVHHLNPRIPYHRLPEAFTAIKELQEAGRTALTVRGIWSCLRLKLWDTSKGRMVGFRDKL